LKARAKNSKQILRKFPEFFGGLSARDRAMLKSLLLKIVKTRDLRGTPTD